MYPSPGSQGVTELLSVISQLQYLIVAHINWDVITPTAFFRWWKGAAVFCDEKAYGHTVISLFLRLGKGISRAVVKSMLVNVRWSGTRDKTSIQMNPHLYQAKKTCRALKALQHIHILYLSRFLSLLYCCSQTTEISIRIHRTITLPHPS